MKQLIVKSVVIDWPTEKVEFTSTMDEKHTVQLDKNIVVTMVGFPDRETIPLQAGALASYMTKGYIIERVTFEEEEPQPGRYFFNGIEHNLEAFNDEKFERD